MLKKPEFPRSIKYHPDWILENQMGPNALWLLEWLCQTLPFEAGMRVLDLGCGKAMTSIFLAREFGVHVWAADLWMNPDNNWRRIVEAGVSDLVCPMRAEGHSLPFAKGFFDAVVCIDAYHYFGTDELYLDYLSRFIRQGGSVGVVVPGCMQHIGDPPPEHLTQPQANGKVFWESSCRSFKTAGFWTKLWERCPMLADTVVDTQPDGWRHWRDFELAVEAAGKGIFPSDAEALEKDQGRFLGFLRLTARRTETEAQNLYDPGLGMIDGLDR
jgi:SAM-dependent methyltransferase